jgi:hypothetical protein
MNLLPLQIVLGLQVAAAVVIFLQLMKGDDADEPLTTERGRGASIWRRRIARRTFEDNAR